MTSGPGSRPGWLKPVGAGAALLLLVLGVVLRFDVGGVRAASEERWPALARVPLIGSGTVYPQELRYTTVEGGADPAGTFTLVFSRPVAGESVGGEAIRLLGPDSARVPVRLRVPPDRHRVEISPEDSLELGATYALWLGGGLRGVDGHPVRVPGAGDAGGVWRRFDTRPPPPDRTPPVLASSRPAPGTEGFPADSPLILSFDEPVDVGSVNRSTVELVDEQGASVEVEVLCCSELRKVRVRAPEGLSSGARYTLRLSSGITDTAGNALRPDTVTFRTGRAGGARRRPQGPATFTIRVLPEEAVPHVRVRVADQDLGTPPVRGHRVAPGRGHRVQVVGSPPQSGKTLTLYSRVHRAGPGQTAGIVARVRPFGSVIVASRPVGRVYVDGDPLGLTPLAGHPLPSGSHRLTVRPREADADRLSEVTRTFELGAWEWNKALRVELPSR